MRLHIAPLCLLTISSVWNQPAGQIETNAGNWKTWIITSGKDYRVPPPPDAAATKAELEWLKQFAAQRQTDPRIAPQITYWDAGSPAYRWMDLVQNRYLNGEPVTAYPHRVLNYVAMAMYDATIATWDSKYTYNRQRPSAADSTLQAALPVPNSPSYPSEHAAASAAAAEVLAYFFPNEAGTFRALAEESGGHECTRGCSIPVITPREWNSESKWPLLLLQRPVLMARMLSGPVPFRPANACGLVRIPVT